MYTREILKSSNLRTSKILEGKTPWGFKVEVELKVILEKYPFERVIFWDQLCEILKRQTKYKSIGLKQLLQIIVLCHIFLYFFYAHTHTHTLSFIL